MGRRGISIAVRWTAHWAHTSRLLEKALQSIVTAHEGHNWAGFEKS